MGKQDRFTICKHSNLAFSAIKEMEQIRTCPQIKTTNLYYKTQDAFSDFDCPRSAFYRYVLQLKRDYGFEKFTGRQTKPREDTPPGYEAQVDFGQSKMLDSFSLRY